MNFKIGQRALRLNRSQENNTLSRWVEFTVNETYLPLMAEFPEDYKPLHRKPIKPGVTITAYGYISGDEFSWETAGISLLNTFGGLNFWLCQEEIDLIRRDMEEITPMKNERWHKIWLNRIYCSPLDNDYEDDWYSLKKIQLFPITCERCGSKIKEAEADKIIKAGVTPYCSLYCANVASGVPIPGSNGDWDFERHNIQYG